MSYKRTVKHKSVHGDVMRKWWADPKNKRRMKGKGGFRLGHQHSEETKKRIGAAHRGRKKSPQEIKNIRQANLKRMEDPIQREKLRQAGLLTPEQRARQIAAVSTPENREKMRKNILNRKFRQEGTDIELLLMAEFRKRRLSFETQKPMFRRWKCDFVFVDAMLIVEADGEYWHSLPGRKGNDKRMTDFAVEQGWTVFRFPGKQIYEDAKSCARAVAKFVRSKEKKP